MSSAVITYCGHFFHGNCLRKWLYVQETCPMCHQAIRPTLPERAQASGGAPSADLEPPAQEKNQNEDNDVSQETQPPSAMPDPSEPQEEMEIRCGTNHQPVGPQGDNYNHFSPNRDLLWSCTSGATLSSGVHKKDEEDVGESPLPSSPEAANQNSQAEITKTDFKLNSVPQRDNGESERCVEAPRLRSGSRSHDSTYTRLFNSQNNDKSLRANSEDNDVTQSYSDWPSDLDLDGPRDWNWPSTTLQRLAALHQCLEGVRRKDNPPYLIVKHICLLSTNNVYRLCFRQIICTETENGDCIGWV